jgi:hypothetical protein
LFAPNPQLRKRSSFRFRSPFACTVGTYLVGLESCSDAGRCFLEQQRLRLRRRPTNCMYVCTVRTEYCTYTNILPNYIWAGQGMPWFLRTTTEFPLPMAPRPRTFSPRFASYRVGRLPVSQAHTQLDLDEIRPSHQRHIAIVFDLDATP